MAYTITTAQVVAALGLTQTNQTAATGILNASGLTGVSLTALGMLIKNEVGGIVSQSYSVQPPVAGAAAGQSGWTIGVTQLDFNKNPTNASALLTQALVASGSFNRTDADNIANAFSAAGTSSNVTLPNSSVNGNPITFKSINTALSSVNAENVINANAGTSVSGLLSGIDNVVSQLNTQVFKHSLPPVIPHLIQMPT